jgi:SP family general alpha glucoside:H+ symporter-like MFS transporter
MSEKHEVQRSGSADIGIEELKDHNLMQSDILVDKELMINAYDGENAEHEETVWEAAKTHPMACLWAFIFCFTIVSGFRHILPRPSC